MHILMVSEFFPSLQNQVFSGGVEVRCFYTALHISKKHTITVFARRKKGELAFEEKGKLRIYRFGREVDETSATIASMFSRLVYIAKVIIKGSRLDIDIVEGSNFVTLIPAFIISRIKKIPAIAFYPDVLLSKWKKLFGSLLGGIGELVERCILKLTWDTFITISQSVKHKLERNNIDPHKIEVIPCGVDLSKIPSHESKIERLIVVSRLVGYKRVDWAIKLLKEIELEFPQMNLLIIGNGPEEGNLKHVVKNLGLSQKVSFLSHISTDSLYQELGKSLLLLHPSLVEGFGIVLVEANSLGVPFVAADIPTSKELVATLGGIIFAQDDFSDFVSKTKILIKDEKKRELLKAKGLANVAPYDWEQIAKQTEELYKKILIH